MKTNATKKNTVWISPGAPHTCNDLLGGAVGAVTGLILGHHCNVVGQTALQVANDAVTLIRPAAAGVTLAAHH